LAGDDDYLRGATSINHQGDKNVSDLRKVDEFIPVLQLLPPIKTDSHDIPEILLKVALNTTDKTKPTIKMYLLCMWPMNSDKLNDGKL
jgi:hypothetical protein